jgi:hypothetical protein
MQKIIVLPSCPALRDARSLVAQSEASSLAGPKKAGEVHLRGCPVSTSATVMTLPQL